MAKEWQTFVRKFDDIREGEAELFIKDLTPGPRKYDTRHVRARVGRSKRSVRNGDLLWLRSEAGIRAPKPWYIQILEELPECVPGKPWQDVFEAVKKQEKGKN